MVEVEFTKKFGIKKKGDTGFYDGMLASQLVRIDKVAKYVKKEEK